MNLNDILSPLRSWAIAAGSWISDLWTPFLEWLRSSDGDLTSQWLAAIGTVGAVIFAVWSTVSDRGYRTLMQEISLSRAGDEAIAARHALADPVSLKVTKVQSSRLRDLALKLTGNGRYFIRVHNASPYPVHHVGIFHYKHVLGSVEDINLVLYDHKATWGTEVIPAGETESFEVSERQLGSRSDLVVRFETVQNTCWTKDESGELRLISDGYLLGVSSIRAMRLRLKQATREGRKERRKLSRKRKAARKKAIKAQRG